MDFWDGIDRLVANSQVVIDRPVGSAHPRFPSFIYPLDYGYLDGTVGGDGDGVDVWLGSGNQTHANAVICTVDLLRRDAELKILLGCTASERQTIMRFLNAETTGCKLIERPGT
jgi:inorganic pyrophosphatase